MNVLILYTSSSGPQCQNVRGHILFNGSFSPSLNVCRHHRTMPHMYHEHKCYSAVIRKCTRKGVVATARRIVRLALRISKHAPPPPLSVINGYTVPLLRPIPPCAPVSGRHHPVSSRSPRLISRKAEDASNVILLDVLGIVVSCGDERITPRGQDVHGYFTHPLIPFAPEIHA